MSEFWDFVEKFHGETHHKYSHGKEGFAAIQYLQSVIKPNWKEEYAKAHPIRHQLLIASDDTYFDLALMHQKLLIAEGLKGFQRVRRKLGIPKEFLNAMFEVEVAFRFCIGEGIVEFLPETHIPDNTDLSVRFGSDIIHVEVTSVNPPTEDDSSIFEFQLFSLGFLRKVNISGIISDPQHINELDDVENRAKIVKAVDDALNGNKLVELNERGIYQLYIRPAGHEDGVPPQYRDGFVVRSLAGSSHLDKIARAIRGKTEKEYREKGSWYLVLSDRLMNDKEFNRILTSDVATISDLEATYPDLIGTMLLASSEMNNPQPNPQDLIRKDRMISVYALPPFHTEAFIVWLNPANRSNLPVEFNEALTKYDRNLEKFLNSVGLEWA